MSKSKSKLDNIPRRKGFKRTQRLESARSWLPTYDGKKLFQAYRKRYGVDWQTAFTELELLGVKVDPAYKELVLRTIAQQTAKKRQKHFDRAAEEEREQAPEKRRPSTGCIWNSKPVRYFMGAG